MLLLQQELVQEQTALQLYNLVEILDQELVLIQNYGMVQVGLNKIIYLE